MTFNELLQRFEAATPAERQRVLDMIPHVEGSLTAERSALARELWESALRAVFESGEPVPLAAYTTPCEMCGHAYQACNRPNCIRLKNWCPPTEKTEQGLNYVLPGTERSAHQAVVARGQKIRPSAKQRDPGGMFEPIRCVTPDLFS